MKRMLTLLLCLGIALALPDIALAQKVGAFTVVQGTVDLIPAGKAAHAAKQGEPVQIGDSVRTRQGGRAEITFNDGTIIRMARATEMAISQFLIGDKRTDAQISLPRGKIQSIVPKKVGQLFGRQEPNHFEVKTPTATCGVRGTNFFTYFQNGISGATFKEGQGYFYNNSRPDQVSMIEAGQTGIIGSPDGKPVIRPATQGEMNSHGRDTDTNGRSSNNNESDDTGLAYTPPPPTDDTPPIPPTPPVIGPITIYIPPPIPDPDPVEDGTDVVVDYGVDPALAVNSDGLTSLLLAPRVSTTSFDYTLTDGTTTASGTATSAIGLPVDTDTTYTLTTTHDDTTDGSIDFLVQSYDLSGASSEYLYDSSSTVSGTMAMALDPQTGAGFNWGGWHISIGNYDDISALPTAWSLFAGGGLSNNSNANDYGYWLMASAGTGTTGIVSGLTYLTTAYYGVGTGSATATYDGSGFWSVTDVAAGSVTAIPLAFSGSLNGNFLAYDSAYSSFSYLDNNGFEGLLGAIPATLFNGTETPVLLMGQVDTQGSDGQPLLFNGSIDGSALQDNGTTTSGYVAGVWRNNIFTGRVASLYLDANGNIGYLTGSVAGDSYAVSADTAMWVGEGNLTASPQEGTDYLPSDFLGLLNPTSFYGSGFGQTSDSQVALDTLEGQFLQVGTRSDLGPAVWAADLGGTYIGTVADNWQMKMGGYVDNPDESEYWFAVLTGSQWGSASDPDNHDLAATLSGTALSQTHLNQFQGDVLGTFDANGGWQAVGIGTQTSATPLAMSGIIDYTVADYGPEYGLSASPDGFGYYEYTSGLLGATESPWYQDVDLAWQTRPIDAVLMGEYSANDPIDALPYLWHNVTYSYDVTTGNNTTFDNGAFGGYVAGAWRNGAINGYLASIYLDPAGNAGVLVGDLLGSYFPSDNATSMFEASGTLTPIPLATGIAIAPADFYNELQANTNPTLTATVAGQFVQTDTAGNIIASSGYLNGVSMAGWQQGIPGQDWGLLMLIIDGSFDGPTNRGYDNPDSYTEWAATISGSALNLNGDPNFQYEAIASGTAANNDIDGTLAGAWVDIDRATTGVAGGKIMGSFDPANESWQAVALGVGIETSKFLEMAATDTGRAQLTALNIPNIEIGRADLTGANAVFTEAHMNDVTFFAYRSGEMAKIWASGNVGGTVASNPTGQSVALSGLSGAITANLNMQTWNTVDNKWAATVTGGQASQLLKAGSPVNVNLSFHGNAAGQITTSTTFGGTGSGVVTPAN